MCIVYEDDNKVIGYKILCFFLILCVCFDNFKKNYNIIIEEWFNMMKGLILNFYVYIYNKLFKLKFIFYIVLLCFCYSGI